MGQWRIWGLAGILSILSSAALAEVFLDFSYTLVRGGTPVTRVYDDGHRTYLILADDVDPRTLQGMASSVAAKRKNEILSVPIDRSLPYPSIAGVYDRIVLSVGTGQLVATYVGRRWGSAPAKAEAVEKLPLIEVGEKISIHKIPVEESREVVPEENWKENLGVTPERNQEENVEEAAILDNGGGAEVAPEPAPPIVVPTSREVRDLPPSRVTGEAPIVLPTSRDVTEALPSKVLPNNQVVRVMAKAEDPPSPLPVIGAVAGPEKAGELAGTADNEVAEYKVMVPFVLGKTALGKEGEKAMAEITQIGPIAREIRIRAPGDSGRDLQRAYGRAAEIHKLLVKAGLVRQRISIEVVDVVPAGKVVQAEVALIVDLGRTAKK